MNTRVLVLVAGAALLIAGVLGLLWPISTSDGGNQSVGCGMAIKSDLGPAQAKDKNLSNAGADVLNQIGAGSLSPAVPGQTNYVAACNSALGTQRTWSIPVTVVGVLVLAGSFLIRRRSTSR